MCFLNNEDQVLLEKSLPNSIARASQIRGHILSFNHSIQYDRNIIVGMEATSVYNFHPSTFLAENQDLKAQNVEVVVINPKAIHRFKGLFDEDKTDPFIPSRVPLIWKSQNHHFRWFDISPIRAYYLIT
ncbi:transposase [Acetobacterium sp. MES1]|uniref:IS110 family transposase n=1 Tax=Acetobacterium sp. MES1 TaxID=1899015 RepID=UPI00338D9F55